MENAPYVRRLTWLPDGRMEIVPLFPFVYHEYGPVAVQGIYAVNPWNLPAAEDFFTWAEARAVLWGGLIVSFPTTKDAAPSESRIRYLRSLAAARMNFARDYLAYGRMHRPPEIDCGTIEIDHGLAEGGWLRKIRFDQPRTVLPGLLETPEKPAGNQDRPGELSVEQWVKEMLAAPATPAQHANVNSSLGFMSSLHA